MKNFKNTLAVALVAGGLLLAGVTPAKAESMTFKLNGVSQGTFSCDGNNGCHGNDLTVNVNTLGPNPVLTLLVDTTNNTNAGTLIASVAITIGNLVYNGNVSLTSDPGGAWSAGAGQTASGGGCKGNVVHSICAQDDTVAADQALLDGSTHTWVWTLVGQTFTGFDLTNDDGDVTDHLQVAFADPVLTGKCGNENAPCFKGTGLISAHAGDENEETPEPATIAMLGIGVLGFAAARRTMR